jgi:hypothetical protein
MRHRWVGCTVTLASAILDRVGVALPGEGVLVVDPDELVREELVIAELAGRGTKVLSADDPVDLRLAFEALPDDRGFIVSVDSSARRRSLPADLQARSVREAALSAADLLQPLDVDPAVRLSWHELSVAWESAQQGVPRDRRTTISLLLRKAYELDPETSGTPEALLTALARYHRVVRGTGISPGLATAFAERVGDPLEPLTTERAFLDRRAFLEWLQELWHRAVTGAVEDWLPLLTSPPLADILDDYFDEGLLVPVVNAAMSGFRFGVAASPEAGQELVDRQLDAVEKLVAPDSLSYHEWRDVADAFARATAQQLRSGDPSPRFGEVRERLNRRFVPWMLEHLSALASLPAVPSPVTVYGVPRSIQLTRAGQKAALIVMDGMSLASWHVMAPRIHELDAQVNESALFAWLPTLTTVSRQAIFAGAMPLHFASSIETTTKEADHWRAYWNRDASLADSAIGYGKFRLADLKSRDAVESQLRQSGLGREILGFAVEDIDLLLHSEVMDERALFNRIGHWLEREAFLWMLDALLEAGYRIYVTADHGFVPADSIGGSKAGATADKHGRFERYSDPVLADAAGNKTGEPWRRWAGYGLPADHHIVFAPMFGMYFTDRHTRLTHGGPTIEEVVVPWVEIYR